MSTPGIQSGTESETSKLSSFNASSADRDTSTATDVESLEYVSSFESYREKTCLWHCKV